MLTARDGLSLSWAISERMLTESRGYCFFATHFFELTTLPQLYPNAKNFHLTVDTRSRERPIYVHTVEEGPLPESSYGLASAGLILPGSVIERAKEFRDKLAEKLRVSKQAVEKRNQEL